MFKLPVANWIANAAARFTGTHGVVTQHAESVDCSRQTVYEHAAKVQAAVEAEHSGGPTRAQLLQTIEELRQENAQLWDTLNHSVEVPPAKQQEFTATATAMGLSLNQVLVLLGVILGPHARPCRSTVHRWVKAAGIAAGRVLKPLDALCQTVVLVGCLDEIFFHGRPVLVGVEPASMVWFLGQKADNCKGTTWVNALRPWTALSYVVADAGSGLQAGIAAVQRERLKDGGKTLDHGLDVFHTVQEGKRVLRVLWNRVEQTWEQAEAARRKFEKVRGQKDKAPSAAQTARHAWRKAESEFRRYERDEAAWKIAHAALEVFRPDGTLNHRVWAQEQIALALGVLTGLEWSKVRGFLQSETALTFLDRLHGQLEAAVPGSELRGELVRLWWLRRQRPRSGQTGAVSGAGHVAHLVQQVVCQKWDANWVELYLAVSQVLRGRVRASSAVECMNSVLRMHQSRHRTLNQGLLDLKRLYWNSREFRGGKRRGRCPYAHLGLTLPTYDFWSLLRGEMRVALAEEKAQAKAQSESRPRAKAA
jgi:hypothetical protein